VAELIKRRLYAIWEKLCGERHNLAVIIVVIPRISNESRWCL
jgi:hypothetical protein